MRRCLLTIILVCLAAPWPVSARPEVEVKRSHGIFSVHVTAPVVVDAQTAWQVLTDYNHLADFVPGMKSSRVISAAGEPLRIEQKGETRFLFFSREFHVVLAIEELPPEQIKFHAVGGDMKRMQGEWRVRADGAAGVRLEYEAEIEPGFWVPIFLGTALMRHDVSDNIEGVAGEMLKRHAAVHGKTAASPP
ncbi:MAG TPA: SRPBCC family protein [Burkholderiales bacterium]|nr:SRPBCC family protein [Burkholderiales bacterium]